MAEVRFEFYLIPIWFVISLFILKKFDEISLNYKLAIFLVSGYGPLYPLLSLGISPFVVNLSLFAAFIVLYLTGFKYFNFYPLLFCFCGVIILLPIVFDQNILLSLPKAFLIFIISISGLNFGVKVSRDINSKSIIMALAMIYCLESISTILIRYFYAADLRDAGYPLLLVSFALYLLCIDYKYRIVGLLGLMYIIIIQTRSAQLILLISIFMGTPYLRKAYGAQKLLIAKVLIISIIVIILISRTFYDSQLDQNVNGFAASFQTRENAIQYEWNKFLESPFWGNGIFYFDTLWRELLEEVLTGNGDDNYAAFNHVGIVSTLAQIGIFGFILVIMFPIIIYQNFKPLSHEDFWIKVALLSYFVSFLISGSPLRTDFPDQFFYMFCIGYCFNSLIRNYKKLSRMSNE